MNTPSVIVALLAVEDSKLFDTLVGFLPIVVFLLILFFLFRRQQRSPVANLQREYLRQQIELMPRIEALLERIAKALERDGKT